jgi:hypothetical protein
VFEVRGKLCYFPIWKKTSPARRVGNSRYPSVHISLSTHIPLYTYPSVHVSPSVFHLSSNNILHPPSIHHVLPTPLPIAIAVCVGTQSDPPRPSPLRGLVIAVHAVAVHAIAVNILMAGVCPRAAGHAGSSSAVMVRVGVMVRVEVVVMGAGILVKFYKFRKGVLGRG